MTRADFDTLCSEMPGALLSGAGELDAWKVGGKMFACFGHTEQRATNTDTASVKCPDVETASMLIDAGAARKAAYFHRSWVTLDLDRTEADEARHRIAVSYDTIRNSLKKADRDALPPRETH